MRSSWQRSKLSAQPGELPILLPPPKKLSDTSEQLSSLLLPEQEQAAKWIVQHPEAGLFFEQRTGKTLITLRAIQLIAPTAVLIVCPLVGKNQAWLDQIKKFLPKRNVITSFADFSFLHNYRGILILHYEELYGLMKKLQKVAWSMIIFDESQRLKARNTEYSRMARRLRERSERKIILSGTPVEKQPQDLWGQFRFIAPYVFGERWADFKEEYLKPTGYMGYKLKFRQEKMPQFLSKIEPYVLRMKRSELGILDPEIIPIPVYMLGDQRELYDTLEREMVADFATGSITADLEVTKLVKLQQITGGFIRDNEEEWHHVGDAKLRKLKWLLGRIKLPFIVACQFREEMNYIQTELIKRGLKSAWFYGKTKIKERNKILDDFKAGKLDAVVMQVRTGGTMVDFSAATCGILYSTTHSSIDYDQVVSRLSHINRRDRPTIFHLYVSDTVDEDKLTAINRKISLITAMMKRLRGTNG